MPNRPYDDLVASFTIADISGANSAYSSVARNCITKRLDVVVTNVSSTAPSTLTLSSVSPAGSLTTLGTIVVGSTAQEIGAVNSVNIAKQLTAGTGLRLASGGESTVACIAYANLIANTLV
jgi:hypothetical protein